MNRIHNTAAGVQPGFQGLHCRIGRDECGETSWPGRVHLTGDDGSRRGGEEEVPLSLTGCCALDQDGVRATGPSLRACAGPIPSSGRHVSPSQAGFGAIEWNQSAKKMIAVGYPLEGFIIKGDIIGNSFLKAAVGAAANIMLAISKYYPYLKPDFDSCRLLFA